MDKLLILEIIDKLKRKEPLEYWSKEDLDFLIELLE